MANEKISDMTELAETPAYDDEIPLLDSSANTTKKILISNLLNVKDVDSYVDLESAIATWNADGSDVTLLVKSAQAVDDDLTINGNISIIALKEALITIANTLSDSYEDLLHLSFLCPFVCPFVCPLTGKNHS